jgi:hypothetical protein
LSSSCRCGREREREREKRKLWGLVRDTTVLVRAIETKLAVLEVPRQYPLDLLVDVRLVRGIRSILIFKELGAAARG